MAFTLNRGLPYNKDIDGADNQLNKEEAESIGIDNETFERADTNNTGKLDSKELATIPNKDAAETIEPIAIEEPKGLPGYKQIDAQVEFPNKDSAEEAQILPTGEEADGATSADILPTDEDNGTTPPIPPTGEAYSTPGALDSSNSLVDKLTNSETNKGVEARIKELPILELSAKPFSPTTDPANPIIGFKFNSNPISWDDVKGNLRTLGGGGTDGLVGVGTLDGISEDSFNPEVENPSYSTGHEIELPGTGDATSTTGPTETLFKDIMRGSFKKATQGDPVAGMPSTPNKVGGKSSSTLAKMSKNKKAGETQKSTGTPLKLSNKNAITQGKENIYERIIDKVQKNYQSWPLTPDGESRVKEKGTVAVYAKKDWISVKYGSYRKTLLDTFAQEHPQFLPQILEVVNS